MEQIARFLPNRPIGKDLYDGQSQDRVANAIKEHMLDVDAIENNNSTLPRIIGIEGSWGQVAHRQCLSTTPTIMHYTRDQQ